MKMNKSNEKTIDQCSSTASLIYESMKKAVCISTLVLTGSPGLSYASADWGWHDVGPPAIGYGTAARNGARLGPYATAQLACSAYAGAAAIDANNNSNN